MPERQPDDWLTVRAKILPKRSPKDRGPSSGDKCNPRSALFYTDVTAEVFRPPAPPSRCKHCRRVFNQSENERVKLARAGTKFQRAQSQRRMDRDATRAAKQAARDAAEAEHLSAAARGERAHRRAAEPALVEEAAFKVPVRPENCVFTPTTPSAVDTEWRAKLPFSLSHGLPAAREGPKGGATGALIPSS